MISPEELRELLDQARRNEDIQRRLDMVEEFLLSRMGLMELFVGLPAKLTEVYELETVTLTLSAAHPRLAKLFQETEGGRLPECCAFRNMKEIRLLLGDMERPFITNRPTRDMADAFFPLGPPPASLAVLPLWTRGQWMGSLNLGSASATRYRPDLDTHFLLRLAKKAAQGLDSALLMEDNRRMEKREAVMEMAGAACHDLAQPLTALGIKLETMIRRMGEDDPLHRDLLGLKTYVDRMGEQIDKIRRVNQYVTRDYAADIRIVDLDAASCPPGTGGAGDAG